MPFFQGKKEFGKVHPKVEQYTSSPKKISEIGDILLSVRAPVGPTNISNIQCCIGRGLGAIRPNQENVFTNYLLYFFKKFELEIASKGRGSTFSAITRKDLESIQIPLPPLSKQKAIAQKLDLAKALIDLRKVSIEKLDELAKSVFVEMFGDPVENPMGWEKTTLSKLNVELEGGKSIAEDKDNIDGNRILKISAITTGVFNPQESKLLPKDYIVPVSHYVKKDDLLMSRANTSLLIGATAYVWSSQTKIVLPDKIWRFIYPDQSKLNTIFHWKLFQNQSIRNEISKRASGTGGSMRNISKPKVLSIFIILPPLTSPTKIRQNDRTDRIPKNPL